MADRWTLFLMFVRFDIIACAHPAQDCHKDGIIGCSRVAGVQLLTLTIWPSLDKESTQRGIT